MSWSTMYLFHARRAAAALSVAGVHEQDGTMTQRVTAPRGVYRVQERYKGRWIYYAWSSRGEILDIWRPRRGETDAEIVWGLATLLRIEDRSHLRLHRATRLDVSDLRPSSSRPSERRPA